MAYEKNKIPCQMQQIPRTVNSTDTGCPWFAVEEWSPCDNLVILETNLLFSRSTAKLFFIIEH